MRMNIYSQELITEPGPPKNIELVTKEADTGIVYSAVRMFLISPDQLHHTEYDDDRSAITFWLPRSSRRRHHLAESFMRMARMIENAPLETGLD